MRAGRAAKRASLRSRQPVSQPAKLERHLLVHLQATQQCSVLAEDTWNSNQSVSSGLLRQQCELKQQ